MKLGGGGNPSPAPAPMPPAPTDAAPADDMDFNGDTAPAEKPFGDTPFDAGVEADEETDPKKFIEQLTGKLGQSLRTFNQQQGQPDFELEKFAINSLLSATHTGEMNPDDQKDIINKIKSSGNGEGDTENDSEGDMDNEVEPEGDMDFGGDENQVDTDMNEAAELFLENPPKNNMFQEGSNDILELKENLISSKKNGTFVSHDVIKLRLKETFNQDMDPVVKPKPTVDPKTAPVEPSRRNKPFLPKIAPSVQPAPKAIKESTSPYPVYHGSFSSAVGSALEYAKSLGYDVSEDEWFAKVSTGNKKPDDGVTNRYSLALTKGGVPVKNKNLNMQVYGMHTGYELNCYVA